MSRRVNFYVYIIIIADHVFIDPTFFSIFVYGPLQSLVVNVCNSIEILTLKRDILPGLSSFEVEDVTDCFLFTQFKFFQYFDRVSVSLYLLGAKKNHVMLRQVDVSDYSYRVPLFSVVAEREFHF